MGDLAAHADGVVDASAFGEDLGGVGEVEAVDRGAVGRDALAVVASDDGLGAVDAVVGEVSVEVVGRL